MPQAQENDMTAHKMLYGALGSALLLSACVVAPRHGAYVVAPPLPVVVEMDVVPYYHSGFYYHYYHDNRRWTYSRSKAGPWYELPRDRYPREIRYRDRGQYRDRDRGADRDRGRYERDR
jgi:hypothetical protein